MKRAFDALSHSTHLFGRRLVLEYAEPEKSQDVEVLRMREEQMMGGPTKAKKLKKSQLLEDLGGKDENFNESNDF
jgi:multiple RNA-binding domain-containing protein 1